MTARHSLPITQPPRAIVGGFYDVEPAAGTAYPALVSGAWILNGATSGQDSGWIPYVGGMRLAYALDSGTASTTFAVDYSVNGTTSEGQAFTGTWASSTVFERTPPLWLSEYEARFIRVTVTSGGPLSVYRF